ncbi:MAG: DUF2281 domain-containing protein [Candidatus Hydrogenedentes bacterium]|nr:DUF2281 domain-containing protein [Candidatus Hydrogenedentota bacterium]
MGSLLDRIAHLSPEKQAKVEQLVSELEEKAPANATHRLKLTWLGGLKDSGETRSSVEIQHDILDSWRKNVSG